VGIYFDTDSEEFYTLSNQYDKENTKKVLHQQKNILMIENSSFKPVMVQKFETTFSSAEIIKLVGIRKDNKLYEEMVRLNNCQHMMKKNYFLVNTENDKIELKIKELLVDKDKIIRQVKEMENG
jgi:FlaA1/EpsC-like NDP-sugar epimerase